jgi:hypothetical protein
VAKEDELVVPLAAQPGEVANALVELLQELLPAPVSTAPALASAAP